MCLVQVLYLAKDMFREIFKMFFKVLYVLGTILIYFFGQKYGWRGGGCLMFNLNPSSIELISGLVFKILNCVMSPPVIAVQPGSVIVHQLPEWWGANRLIQRYIDYILERNWIIYFSHKNVGYLLVKQVLTKNIKVNITLKWMLWHGKLI